jgi:hypothetical protein
VAKSQGKKKTATEKNFSKTERKCVKAEEYIQQLLSLSNLQRVILGNLQKELLG